MRVVDLDDPRLDDYRDLPDAGVRRVATPSSWRAGRLVRRAPPRARASRSAPFSAPRRRSRGSRPGSARRGRRRRSTSRRTPSRVVSSDTTSIAAPGGWPRARRARRRGRRSEHCPCGAADRSCFSRASTIPTTSAASSGAPWRSARAAYSSVPGLLRSALPEGAPRLDGRNAGGAVRAGAGWPGVLASSVSVASSSSRSRRPASVRSPGFAPPARAALLLGAEETGLSAAARAAADVTVAIRMTETRTSPLTSPPRPRSPCTTSPADGLA